MPPPSYHHPETVQDVCQLLSLGGDLHLDLSEVNPEDGPETSVLLTAIKAALEKEHHLVLRHPSQMIAHNLYRTGLLDHPLLVLEEIRMEEGSAS